MSPVDGLKLPSSPFLTTQHLLRCADKSPKCLLDTHTSTIDNKNLFSYEKNKEKKRIN